MVNIPPDRSTAAGLPRAGRRRAPEGARASTFATAPTAIVAPQAPDAVTISAVVTVPDPAAVADPAVHDGASSPASSRRRAGSTPTTGQQSNLRRLRSGLQVRAVPVSALVTVELIVLAAVLAVTVRTGWSWVLMVVAVLLVLLLVPVRGLRLGGWLRSAIGYRLHGHLTQALPSGASTGGTYPVVSAFFPAASIRDGVDHGGRPVGILRWRESLNVSCRVSADVAEPLSERIPIALPLESLCASVFSSGIPVDSLQVFTQYRSADPLRTDSAVLGKLADALSQSTALARVRDSYVSVRLNPLRAADAIAMRGGGDDGVDRVLAALTSRLSSELRKAGLRCEVLDGEALGKAVTAAFIEPAGTEDDAIRWLESWRRVGSAKVQHRSLVVTGWGRVDLEPVLRIPCLAISVVTQLRPGGADVVHARTTVRISAGSLRELTDVTSRVRETVRLAGGSVRELRGAQLAALRVSSPIGGW